MDIFIQLYFFQHIGINNNKNGKKLQVRTKIRRQLKNKSSFDQNDPTRHYYTHAHGIYFGNRRHFSVDNFIE